MEAPANLEFYPPKFSTPFSTGVRVGDVLYLSGQIGMLDDGTLAEGFEAQARQTMENISNSLTAIGASMDDVFKCTIMLRDMSMWEEFNDVYLEYFTPGRLPARSAFGSTALALGALMEVECAAYSPQLAKDSIVRVS